MVALVFLSRLSSLSAQQPLTFSSISLRSTGRWAFCISLESSWVSDSRSCHGDQLRGSRWSTRPQQPGQQLSKFVWSRRFCLHLFDYQCGGRNFKAVSLPHVGPGSIWAAYSVPNERERIVIWRNLYFISRSGLSSVRLLPCQSYLTKSTWNCSAQLKQFSFP